MFIQSLTRVAARTTLTAVLLIGGGAAALAEDPFAHGWAIDPEQSELRVTSIKKTKVPETSTFATFSGKIDQTGAAEIRVLTDSIDTKIDLRNVRMRFLFFESFKFPEAVITTRLDPAELAELATVRRKAIALSYSITLHGVTAQRTDRVLVTLLDADTVIISSAEPIYLAVDDFDLADGLQKLKEAANVEIVPLGGVSFDFVFRRTRPGGLTAVSPVAAASSGSAALETKGNFDATACIGRFEILSRTGNIYFHSGSAELQDESTPLLQTLLDIVNRCPDMRVQVAGHTDSDGSASANQRLSEARARAVATWLTGNGVAATRIHTVGFGETQPAFPNTTTANKGRNRRIEFAVLDG